MECSRLKSYFTIWSGWILVSLEIVIYRFSTDAANSCKSFVGLPGNFSPYEIRYKLIEGIQKSKGLRTGNKVKVKNSAASKVSVCQRGKKYFLWTVERDFPQSITPKPSLGRRFKIFRIFRIKCFFISNCKSMKIDLSTNVSRFNAQKN